MSTAELDIVAPCMHGMDHAVTTHCQVHAVRSPPACEASHRHASCFCHRFPCCLSEARRPITAQGRSRQNAACQSAELWEPTWHHCRSSASVLMGRMERLMAYSVPSSRCCTRVTLEKQPCPRTLTSLNSFLHCAHFPCSVQVGSPSRMQTTCAQRTLYVKASLPGN